MNSGAQSNAGESQAEPVTMLSPGLDIRDAHGPVVHKTAGTDCSTSIPARPAPTLVLPWLISEPYLFRVHFDGGGSHDSAYGSWQIVFGPHLVREHRVSFKNWRSHLGRRATSNVSEYLALLGALDWLGDVPNKDQHRIELFGDSQLVIRHLTGDYQCRKEHLRILKDDALIVLCEFAGWSAKWVRRTEMVSRFGH